MFTLTIETDNAAFGPAPADRTAEIVAILRSLADRMDRNSITEGDGRLTDHNGNTVGRWQLSDFDFAAHGYPEA